MRPASPSKRTAAQPPPGTTSILYNSASTTPPPYSVLPSNPHTLPLRYPIATWSAPPKHHITAIAASSSSPSTGASRYVYTASVEGHIVQWEPLSTKQPQQPTAASPTASSPRSPPSPSSIASLSFRPRFLSFRHGSATITALCCVPHLSSFLLCAATAEGFLSVWSSSGQCLSSSFALPFHATSLLPLHSLPSYLSSSSYVMAASSHSPYLYLYSLPSLHPVLLLGHEADGSGIVGVCSISKRARSRPGEEKEKEGSSQPSSGSSTPTGANSAVEEREMVCSVSASGLITVWDIHNKLKKQRDKRAPYPFFSFSTFQSSVLSSSPSASLAPLSITSATASLCLVLTRTAVAVVSMMSLSVLCLVSLADRGWGVDDAVELIALECGSVLQLGEESVLQLVLTTSSRVVLIVRLTCVYDRKRRKDGKVDERCDCELSLDAVIPLDSHRRNKASNASQTSTTASGILLPASTASCVRVVDEHVLVGHEVGEVTVYGLPSLSVASRSSAAVLLPSFYTTLAFAFPHLSLSSLLGPAVTCSHLFVSSSPPFLYHCVGHADGRLYVSSLTASSSPANDIEFTTAAHSSAVRCMLDVEVRGAAGGCQRLLATGGDDGTVCIWKVEERRCRARFYASTAVVALMQLTSPPSSSSLPSSSSSSAFAFPVTSTSSAVSWTLPCLLFVLCACNTIKVYSLLDFSLVSTLPAHSSPPASLSLPSTSSDLLLVLTASGSLYLWAMSAGQLLGVVEAQPGRTGEEKGGLEYWLEQRGGGRTAVVGRSELAVACAQARHELKAKRDGERDSKQRLNNRRGSAVSAISIPSAFASLSSSPFLLSALSALSSSAPLTLPSLTPVPLSPSLRTQQTELVQLLSILFPSAPLQALEKEKREVQTEMDDEEKESNQRLREREKEREDERMEAARERARDIQRDRQLDEQKAQREAEAVDERRRETAGSVAPPVLDVLQWASCSFNSLSPASWCVSVAVLNVPALVEQLQRWYPHWSDGQDGTSASAYTYLRSVLSLLFDWDGKGNVESLLRDQLHLPPPRPFCSFARLSCEDSAVSVLFPSHAYSYRRWQVGEEWSGLHALSISSLCMALLSPSSTTPASPPPSTATVSKLLSYYTTTLIDSPKHYPPSLTQLLSYTLHSSPLVSTSSRLLLQQYLTRLPLHSASALSTTWGEFYDYPLNMDGVWGDWDEKGGAADSGREADDTAVSDSELLVAQLLTMIGVREIDAKRRKRRQQQLLSDSDQFVPFSPLAASGPAAPLTEFEAKSQYITHTLLRVIARPLSSSATSASLHQQQRTTLACDLLCSALSFLRIHISAPLPLLRHLLLLSVSSVSATVVSASSRLLMECGRLAPSFFIECMGREALNSLSPPILRQSSISSLSTLLRTHPLPLSRSLSSSVHTLIRCLDPASPQLRKTMLNVTTAALYALVTLYPAVSFHQQSQRFAVGCWGKDGNGGVILVYDLRTATVWRVMEGHTSDVHAVLFSRDEAGDRLVSYSATEGGGVLRVWNTEVGGWLGGLIGMSGKCVRTVKLERVDIVGLLRRERDVAREKARMALDEEKREEKRREEKGIRKRATPRHLNVQSTLVVNGQDLSTSSPHSFFSSNSPSSSPSVRRLATDSPASASVNPTTPVAGARTPPTAALASGRLPPPPTLHPTSSSSSTSSTSSNGHLTPSPSPSPLSSAVSGNSIPPPLQLSPGDDDEAEEEVEGMGPSIGIATYHALPGAVISGGGVAGSGSDSGAAVTGAMQRRLLCVKLSWINDKVVRVVREDGSVKDVQV